jgi:predicted RecB family nuclease
MVQLVDLLRVSGLTLEDAQVLQVAGVERLLDLAAQDPEQLVALIQDVRAEASLAYTLPSRELVEHWIIQANSLPKAIN